MLRRIVKPTVRAPASRSVTEFKFGQVPLSAEFKGGVQASGEAAKDLGVKCTQLVNGARCITHSVEGAHACVGVYVLAGARYDPKAAPGLSHLMRHSFTTSNMDNSMFQIDRQVRAVGASLEHMEFMKKYIGVRTDARLDAWEPVAKNMFTTMAAPRFHEPDLERMRDTFDNLLEEQRWQNPREYTTDMLETVAFYKEPLGNTRHVLPTTNDLCNHSTLLEHYCKQFVPQNVVIAGVNVDHNELIACYENAPFQHSADAPHFARSQRVAYDESNEGIQYGGGEHHEFEDRPKAMGTKPNMDPETVAAIGFRTYGRDMNTKEYATALVAQQLFNLSIGDAVRYDRASTHMGIRSFYRPFSSVGLIGFTCRGAPGDVPSMVTDAATQFNRMEEQSIEVAKTKASCALAVDTELIREYCDFLGTSFRSGTNRLTLGEVYDAIKQVKDSDIKKLKDLALGNKASSYVTGETLAFPALRQMSL